MTALRVVLGVALVLGAAGMPASVAIAQDLGVKVPAQSGVVVITGVRVHPVSSGVIEKGYIVFEKGVITDVGTGDVPQTGGTATERHVIDGAGLHVYPGLIGPYSQTGLSELTSVRASEDSDETGDFTPEARAAVAVNPDSTLIPVTRASGVLINGVFPVGGVMPGQPAAIRLEGWTWEDMAIPMAEGNAKAKDATKVAAIDLTHSLGQVVNWPTMRVIRASWMRDSEEDQLKQIRESLDEIDRFFDAAQDYAKAKAEDATLPTDLRLEAMRPLFRDEDSDEAKRAQRRVFIQANEVDQIQAAVSWAARRELKAVIVGGIEAPLCAELLKQHGVPVIVPGTFRMPRRDDSPFDEPFTLAKKLDEAGIVFAMASGEETAHERNLPYAAAKAVSYGLPVDAGVRSITLSAAEVLGIDDRYGSLEKGKSATLIVTDGNPLEITTRVVHAFIDGKKIDLSSKQTVLAEKYREKYRQSGEIKDGKK